MSGNRPIVMAGATPEAIKARETLTRALVDLADRDQFPPCHLHPWFLSERQEERLAVAGRCAGCLAFGPCDEAGRFASFGIWGGRDRTWTGGRS